MNSPTIRFIHTFHGWSLHILWSLDLVDRAPLKEVVPRGRTFDSLQTAREINECFIPFRID